MTGHTLKGVPYALPTDALIDYPTASLELANKIEQAHIIGYVEQGSSIPCAGNTEATATPVVNPVAFTADGNGWYWVEFFGTLNLPANGALSGFLFDNGASIGRLWQTYHGATGGLEPVFVKRLFRPAAGDHSVNVRAMSQFVTCSVEAGIGGAGAWVPSYILVTKAII